LHRSDSVEPEPSNHPLSAEMAASAGRRYI
jgi:hypothetical protein